MTDDRGHRIRAALLRVGGGVRFSFRSHPLATGLASLVVVLTAVAVVLGTIRLAGAQSNAVSDQHAQQLVTLAGAVTTLAGSVQDEQTMLAVYVADGRPAGPISRLLYQAQESIVTMDARQVVSLASLSNPRLPPPVQASLSAVLDRVAELPVLWTTQTQAQSPALEVITDYAQVTATLDAFDAQIAADSDDPVIARDLISFSALQRAEDAAAQQRSILAAALTAGQFQNGEQAALSGAVATERSNLNVFQSNAPAAALNAYASKVTGPYVSAADAMLQQALASGPDGSLKVSNPPGSQIRSVRRSWQEYMTFKVDQMRQVEQNPLTAISARSQALHGQTQRTIVETWIEMAVAVLAVVAFAAGVTRRRRSRSAVR